jgi:hypothetical protein
MEILDRHLASNDPRAAAESTSDERRVETAAIELRAAVALVGSKPDYRVLLCGMATDARLIASFDDLAASVGVVLERRIRQGGGLDVLVRSA